MNKDLSKKVGLSIRKLRIKQNISLIEMSDKLDVEYNNLIRIEKGRTNPTISTLYKISDALNIKLSDIFSDADY